MPMLILLPIMSWVGANLLLGRVGLSWRKAFLVASVCWGVLLTLGTEALSLAGILGTAGIATFWGLVAVATFVAFLPLAKNRSHTRFEAPSRTDSALLGGIAFFCLATLVTALAAPPNTWDSMTYHMSRVMHWLQNGSVAHYPTHIVRQLELNPWAEFAIAHFQALSGGDRFANLVQWFSMLGSVIGVTLVAAQLGADRRGQILAAVVTASIPMGILQASSTQNDYVLSFWLICFLWSGLCFKEDRRLRGAAMAGASLGLAILSKGTAYLYALPFVFWFLSGIRCPPRRAALLVIAAFLPILLLNAGHFSRNWVLFSNPLTSGADEYTNEGVTATSALSNVVRNVALQLVTPFDGANRSMGEGIGVLHNVLNIDINDQRTTWQGTSFQIPRFTRQENSSGNVLHAVLAAITLGLVTSRKDVRRSSPLIAPYVFALTTGFLLFCLILKWQLWHSRLHLPLFVLGAPTVAIVLSRVSPRRVVNAVSALLLVAALPYALWNVSRPLLPPARDMIDHVVHNAPLPPTILTADRIPQYFTNRPALIRSFIRAARVIRGSQATSVGLKLGGDDWEYPLWVLTHERGGNIPRFEHVDVENESGRLTSNNFRPELIVDFGDDGKPVVTLPGLQ